MNTINVLMYSERAFALVGDTKPFKTILKDLNGRFNPFLKHPETGETFAGWIFSLKRLEDVKNALGLSPEVHTVQPPPGTKIEGDEIICDRAKYDPNQDSFICPEDHENCANIVPVVAIPEPVIEAKPESKVVSKVVTKAKTNVETGFKPVTVILSGFCDMQRTFESEKLLTKFLTDMRKNYNKNIDETIKKMDYKDWSKLERTVDNTINKDTGFFQALAKNREVFSKYGIQPLKIEFKQA